MRRSLVEAEKKTVQLTNATQMKPAKGWKNGEIRLSMGTSRAATMATVRGIMDDLLMRATTPLIGV